MKLSPISKAIGAMSALLWLGGPGAVAADPSDAAADDASTQDRGPVQYLTLPIHPRPQADGPRRAACTCPAPGPRAR